MKKGRKELKNYVRGKKRRKKIVVWLRRPMFDVILKEQKDTNNRLKRNRSNIML